MVRPIPTGSQTTTNRGSNTQCWFLAIPLIALLNILNSAIASPEDEAKEKGVRSAIVDNVISRFKSRAVLSKEDGATYDSAKDFKAGAACLRWNNTAKEPALVTYWGISWEYESQSAAREGALKQCQQALDNDPYGEKLKVFGMSLGCSCEVILDGSEVKLTPPQKTVDAILGKLKPASFFPTLCREWVTNGEISIPWGLDEEIGRQCDTYDYDQVLRYDFPIERLDAVANTDAPEIYPGPPAVLESEVVARGLQETSTNRWVDPRITFSPPTGQGDYRTPFSLPRGWTYKYQLHRLPSQSAAAFKTRLNALDGSKLFGKFGIEQEFDHHTPKIALSTQFARYIRSYDLKAAPVAIDALDYGPFPEDTLTIATGERSTRLWVVSTIPVDKNWIPLGAPLRTVVPLALETTTSLYVYSSEVKSLFQWRNSAGGNVLVEHKAALDFSRCPSLHECSNRTIATFKNELTKAFTSPSVSASSLQTPLGPNQIQLQRLYEESIILRGFSGPWYEITTYTISVWDGSKYDGERSNEVESSDRYDKANSLHTDRVFVHVDLGLQVGIGKKGRYPEPSADQYAAYKKAVESAVQQAIAATTEAYSGTVVNGVGYIETTKGR